MVIEHGVLTHGFWLVEQGIKGYDANTKGGFRAAAETPQGHAAVIKSDLPKWSKVIKTAGNPAE